MNLRNLLFIFFVFILTNAKAQDSVLIEQVKKMETALLTRDYLVLDKVLHQDLEMGHSNAVIQSKESVKADLKNERITYESIEWIGEPKQTFESKEIMRLRREIKVKGKYEQYPFEMKLSVMEIWTDTEAGMQLWSRQAVKIKD